MSNIIELSAFKCARSSENDEPLEPRAMGRKHRRTARRLRVSQLQSDLAIGRGRPVETTSVTT